MSKLRFCARDDLLVYVPGAVKRVGQAPRYVNRSVVVTPDGPTFPAMPEPFECKASDAMVARLMKFCREGSLLPFDKVTADACGVPFVELRFAEGRWEPKVTKAGKSAADNTKESG